MIRKKKFKFRLFIRNIILVILAIILGWIIVNGALTAFEQKKYLPLGQLVDVDGENMHIYTKGNGENTIVLLAGLGTAAPALDFEPLVNEMSKKNKVVVVEPFGYGWSDITNKKRTVENIVEEIRLALHKANIKGPYILMPHSISGIYSIYYADKYPDEIKAVIGIDPTLPKALEYFNESAPRMPSFMRFIAPAGLARLALLVAPEKFLPIADAGTYSKQNLKVTKTISVWKCYNKNVVAEAKEISNNIDKTLDMSFSAEMPVLIFTARKDKITEDGKSNITFYQTYLSKLTSKKLVDLEGHHYLHWTRYKEMNQYVNEFINNYCK